MTPEKANKLGYTPGDLSLESQSNKHSGNWVVKVKGTDRILTESKSIFELTKWAGQLRDLN